MRTGDEFVCRQVKGEMTLGLHMEMFSKQLNKSLGFGEIVLVGNTSWRVTHLQPQSHGVNAVSQGEHVQLEGS